MSSSHILLLVIAVLVYSAVHTWIKQKGKTPVANPEAEDMLRKIDRLEERIQVLERIITEHNIDLRRQIDSL